MHHFYAEFRGRVYKVSSERSLEITVKDRMGWHHIIDILTGESKNVFGTSLTLLNAMEVLAHVSLGGDERPRTESESAQDRPGPLEGGAQAEEAQG